MGCRSDIVSLAHPLVLPIGTLILYELITLNTIHVHFYNLKKTWIILCEFLYYLDLGVWIYKASLWKVYFRDSNLNYCILQKANISSFSLTKLYTYSLFALILNSHSDSFRESINMSMNEKTSETCLDSFPRDPKFWINQETLFKKINSAWNTFSIR